MKLIVGLGNPGLSYSRNRHNIGFMCLDALAKARRIKFDKKQGKARVGTGDIGGEPVVLAKPQTYMNSSGESVCLLASKYKLAPDDIIVIHDDLDLPVGKLRIRRDGGAGGHKGIKSIISCYGSPDFVRVRVGIGRPFENAAREEEIINYVLNDFSREELAVISPTIEKVTEAVLSLVTDGLQPAMNKYN